MWFVTYTITRTDVQIWRASKHSLGVSGSWGLHVLMSLETLILEAYPACCVLCWMYVDSLLCTAPAVHSSISRSLCQLLFKYQVELAEAISRFEDIRSSFLLLKSSTVTINPVELLNGFCKDIGVGYLLCFPYFLSYMCCYYNESSYCICIWKESLWAKSSQALFFYSLLHMMSLRVNLLNATIIAFCGWRPQKEHSYCCNCVQWICDLISFWSGSF